MTKIVFIWILTCLLAISSATKYSEWLNAGDSDFLDQDALETFRYVQKRSFRNYKRRVCKRWNSHCQPWTNKPEYTCCYSHGLTCKCNLWMHNCRCVSRLWGK